MSSGKRLTNEEALEKINEKCLEKNYAFIEFDNNENVYKNNKTYLTLKCNKCGNIWSTTSYEKFIYGNRGCPNCSPTKKITEDKLIKNIEKLCKEKDFTFLGFNGVFCGVRTKLLLKCNKCGEEWFTTTYNNLRKKTRNTHTCGRKNPSFMPISYNENKIISNIKSHLANTSLEFISFDENGYIGVSKTHILLKCKKCGKINSYSLRYTYQNTISCKNCEYNGKTQNNVAVKFIIEKCKLLNYTFLGFDTDDKKYGGKDCNLILKCNKCGYIWKTTSYYSFTHKTIKCVECKNSWKMEKEIEICLKRHHINYIHDCRNKILPWLKYKASLSLDFYLPDYKIAIECQGRQHFEPVSDFGGEKSFKKTIERDKKKLILCKENNIKLLYYDSEHGNTEFLEEKVYNDENNLIKEITSYEQKN